MQLPSVLTKPHVNLPVQRRASDAERDQPADNPASEDTMVQTNEQRGAHKVVAEPMPAEFTPVKAVDVDVYRVKFGDASKGCLQVTRPWFSRQMVVTYRSETLCSSSGHRLALVAAGIGADGALHIHAKETAPRIALWVLAPCLGAFAVPKMDNNIVLHIDWLR